MTPGEAVARQTIAEAEAAQRQELVDAAAEEQELWAILRMTSDLILRCLGRVLERRFST